VFAAGKLLTLEFKELLMARVAHCVEMTVPPGSVNFANNPCPKVTAALKVRGAPSMVI